MFRRCAFLFALALGGAVRAEESTGCAAFKWPVAQDQSALAAEGLASVENGGAIKTGGATRIRLVASDKVQFLQPPDRPPRPDTYAAVVELAPSAPGVYRLSLSDGAWIDVIEDQDRAALRPLAFSGAKDCPHIRKSLKFRLSGQKATIQISNSATQAISLAILPE
jgi:hypothetical protein